MCRRCTVPTAPRQIGALAIYVLSLGSLVVAGCGTQAWDDGSVQGAGAGRARAGGVAEQKLFVDPDFVDFGRVPVGSVVGHPVTLRNVGGGKLVVRDFFVVSGSGAFLIPEEQIPVEPIELGHGDEVEFEVVFSPESDGADHGVLIVRSDDPTSAELSIEVIANATGPCVEVSHGQTGFDFGPTAVGTTDTEPFTVRNCSDPDLGDPLRVDAIVLRDDPDYRSSPAFSLAQSPRLPIELAPGEGRVFEVEFSPTDEEVVEEAVLQVVSNDPYDPLIEVPIRGGTENVCPVPVARCTVAGSGAPASDELFVLPLDNLYCSAEDSTDAGGEIVEYNWTVVERPSGSSAQFEPDDAVETDFFIDLAGRYVFNLSVVDDRGCESPEPAVVTVVSRPAEDIHVQLVWSTPSDPDETDIGFGAGTDLDLHVLHPNGCWEDPTWDCHFRQREPNWGDPGATNDNPSLDIDDTAGAGPENINLDNPENGITYMVAVHYYNDHGYGVSFATVRIFVFGELIHEARDKHFPYTDFWWVVAGVQWPSTTVTPVDLVYDDVPPCR